MRLKLSPGIDAEGSLQKLFSEVRNVDFETTDTRALLVSHRFYAVPTVAQTIPNNALTQFAYNSILLDPSGMQVQGSFVRIPQTGDYSISGGATFVANATGRRLLRISSRGKGILADQGAPPGNTSVMNMNVGIACVPLDKDDLVFLQVFQNSGGDLDTSPNGDHFSVIRL